MTLPALAAERQRRQHGARSAPAAIAIDISCSQSAQQQSRRPPLLLSIDGTDRQTDWRTGGPTVTLAHVGSVNNSTQ